jgi:hypothetical protein
MRSQLKQINRGLLGSMAFLLIAGLILMVSENETMPGIFLFMAAICLPLYLAAKITEYMISNQFRLAILSILLLSFICMLSIIFVFI